MCESLIGKTIDNFKLLDILGRGGMGCVFKAVDEKMNRIVALKVIRQKFGVFSDREGKALGQLNHANIVHVFYMGENEDGVFIAMEYIDGQTLNHFKKTSVPEALSFLKQSLLALEHAHSAGVIHRDIKPTNIMVTHDKTVKVMDFGLAKVDSGDKNRTMTRFQAGTINYMSPEQVRGLHHVDHRSDLYSLGKAFYEILAGRLPFDTSDSDQFDIWKMIVEVKFKPPSHFNRDIPKGVDQIIMKALEKKAEDRYQDARSMISDIEDYERRQSNPSLGRAVETKPKSARLNRQVIVPLALLAVALVLSAGLYFAGIFDAEPPARPPSPPTTPVLVTTTPPAASLQIDQIERGLTPSDTLRLASGEIRVQVTHVDHTPLDTTVTVQAGSLQRLHFDLNPARVSSSSGSVRLSVNSAPAGATVILDGNNLGTTPLVDAEVESGTHRIEVVLDGYAPIARGVELVAGTNPVESFTLEALGVLDIDATPVSATVSLNGRRVGRTPLQVSREPGQYRVTVTADGYAPFNQTITLQSGATLPISAMLEQQTAQLRVLVMPFGAIELNGTLVRGEESGWHEEMLPMGTHTLRVTHPGYGVWEKEIDLDQDLQEERINFRQEKRVNITSGRIRGAEIYIDGESIGVQAPAEVNLRVGLRRIEVRRDGFTSNPPFYETLIEGEADEPIRVVFELEN